jgi:hypothetical protein
MNMIDLRLKDEEKVPKLSSVISIIILISLIIALVLIFGKVFILSKNLNTEKVNEFKINYSVLTESLKESYKQKLIYFWKPLSLLRWSLTITILIVL